MKFHIYKLLFVSTVFAVSSCGNKVSTETSNETEVQIENNDIIEVTQTQFDQVNMKLGGFEEKSFPNSIPVNGMIDVPPENRAVVNATMGGYIKTTPLLIGDKVRKGQLIVTIENSEFVSLQQEYLEIHEQLNYLKAEYERQKTMRQENITSEKTYLKAESEYKTAVAKHTGLEKQLTILNISPATVLKGDFSSIASIYAPISGSITKVNVSKGTYVSPATSIVEIIDNDHIHIELSVFEKDIMKVKKGQQIIFKIPEASEEEFKAEVHLVGTTIDKNRTIKVHGHLEDESGHNFLTGMFVEAAIVTDSSTAKALPNEAVITIEDTHYVLQLDKKEAGTYSFKKKEVVIKTTSNLFSIIEGELANVPNAQFLTKGVFNLLGD